MPAGACLSLLAAAVLAAPLSDEQVVRRAIDDLRGQSELGAAMADYIERDPIPVLFIADAQWPQGSAAGFYHAEAGNDHISIRASYKRDRSGLALILRHEYLHRLADKSGFEGAHENGGHNPAAFRAAFEYLREAVRPTVSNRWEASYVEFVKGDFVDGTAGRARPSAAAPARDEAEDGGEISPGQPFIVHCAAPPDPEIVNEHGFRIMDEKGRALKLKLRVAGGDRIFAEPVEKLAAGKQYTLDASPALPCGKGLVRWRAK
jgi:hypothetical protein